MAGSRNAFANMATAQPVARPLGVLTEKQHNARPRKRSRLSEDAVASIQTQCAQAETSLEVDHMILEYLAYQTTMACFASRKLDSSNTSHYSLSNNLAMSNAFLSIFKARHPTYEPDVELRLRILLLKLTTLFTQRLTSNPTTPTYAALHSLRATNTERAQSWISHSHSRRSSALNTTELDNNLPMPVEGLERNRAHTLHELDIPAEDEQYEDAFYGTSSCVSLLDLLPLFVEISAVRNAMANSNLNPRWMQLACEFMLQACLEQFLVCGVKGTGVVDEAFAWGYLHDESDHMDLDGASVKPVRASNDKINVMFEDEDYEVEVEGWKDTKTSYLDKLLPTASTNPTSTNNCTDQTKIIPHLEQVAADHPIAGFEAALLKFLEAISKSIHDPVLLQLERGKLDGMSEQETHEFLAECGVDVAKSLYPHG